MGRESPRRAAMHRWNLWVKWIKHMLGASICTFRSTGCQSWEYIFINSIDDRVKFPGLETSGQNNVFFLVVAHDLWGATKMPLSQMV